MRIAVTMRIKPDGFGGGNFYQTVANVKMLKDEGIDLFHLCTIDDVAFALEHCDGLYVPGGADVDPARYGEAVNGCEEFYDEIDELDYAAIKAFHKAGKPILGICRGHQILNVYFGGTLYQDIKDHRFVTHPIDVKKDSFVYDIFGKEEMEVNSYHHQAIKDLAPGFEAVAVSKDGYIEAMACGNIASVQWHPEISDPALFISYFKNKVFL